MVRSRTVLALCDPEPFTVATWMLKSLTTGPRTAPWSAPCTANSVVAINTPYQRWMTAVGKHSIIRQRASGWEVKGRGCRCSKIMSPLNCNETLSPWKDGDHESERVPTGESD